MTLNEIAYNLLNLMRGGKSTHEENISLDQIISEKQKNIFNKEFVNNLIKGQTNNKKNGARLFSLIMLKLMDNK